MTTGTGYVLAITTAILASARHTIALDPFELVKANAGRCQLAGTAVPGV
jgi:hypothetical protein